MGNSRTHLTEFRRTRRNLPHWQEPGSDYFITWTTAVRKKLSPNERTITLNAIRYWDSTRWDVYTAAVMPDHVHLLCRPLWIADSAPRACYTLESILHGVKSFSAHEINKARQQRGAVRLDEREDRIIRSEKEFWQKWDYIRNNPAEAELARSAEEYEWFYQRSGLEPKRFDEGNVESCTHRRDAGATEDAGDAGATDVAGDAGATEDDATPTDEAI